MSHNPPVGRAGTVSSRELTTQRMGSGEGRPCRVIQDGRVMQYVGIGWVDEREARPEDADTCPIVVYPGDDRPHQIAV